MKTIRHRAYFALIIALALFAGLVFFVFKYATKGEAWAMHPANANIFHDGVLDVGSVTDRNGTVLAKAENGVSSYGDDPTVRKACFHAVGDYGGNIGSGALTAFNSRLAGYDLVGGVSSLEGKGGTVKLSIDADLNTVAYNALNGRRGAVLVSNYKTGEILCEVSTPAFDPNSPPDITKSEYEGVYINRCLGAAYAPGSVFKLVTLAAAIEEIPSLYEMSFECRGSVNVGGDQINCTGVHGMQTIEDALANSCNCAFSELSQKLGGETIEKYAEDFGLLKSHKISGIETAAGSFEKAEVGSSNLSWAGIGQFNDLVTPISMLRLVSAIANEGYVKEPTLLKQGSTGKTKLMTSETAEKIRDMMSYNVAKTYGAQNYPNLNLCAKSGTAELGDGSSNAWFVGFLNDSENPLAFTIIVERGGTGFVAAGPIANAVLQAAVAK